MTKRQALPIPIKTFARWAAEDFKIQPDKLDAFLAWAEAFMLEECQKSGRPYDDRSIQ